MENMNIILEPYDSDPRVMYKKFTKIKTYGVESYKLFIKIIDLNESFVYEGYGEPDFNNLVDYIKNKYNLIGTYNSLNIRSVPDAELKHYILTSLIEIRGIVKCKSPEEQMEFLNIDIINNKPIWSRVYYNPYISNSDNISVRD